jgi:hypothetical protein
LNRAYQFEIVSEVKAGEDEASPRCRCALKSMNLAVGSAFLKRQLDQPPALQLQSALLSRLMKSRRRMRSPDDQPMGESCIVG